jgi:hypothetical protein
MGFNQRKEQTFRRRLSEVVCKSPYAAMMETDVVVNDKEKNGDLISEDGC